MTETKTESRLTRIETKIEVICEDVKELKETMPGTINGLRDFLQELVGRYAQREWVEGMDRRIKDLEMWKNTVDHDDSLSDKIHSMEQKLSTYKSYMAGVGAVMSVVAPIIYFLLNNWLGQIF